MKLLASYRGRFKGWSLSLTNATRCVCECLCVCARLCVCMKFCICAIAFRCTDQARLSIWVLKGSRDFQEKARILKYALTADRLQDTLVLLVTPADKLQNLTLCLEYYSNLLLEHIRSFGLSEETFNKPPGTHVVNRLVG